MDKYEREGRKYAQKHGHIIEAHQDGKLFVYEPDGMSEWDDRPDDTFNSWEDYAKWHIGNDLRKLRKHNTKKHLRNN